MIKFILNREEITTNIDPNFTLLDFLRKNHKEVKSGCRRGDCGSCMVLIGELKDGNVSYDAMNSCLIPIIKIDGKHIVTVEGLNSETLTPIQEAIVKNGATQCGYCTPGIVISLTAFLYNNPKINYQEAISALGGNLCRCTGYQSIKNATKQLYLNIQFSHKKNPLENMVNNNLYPKYFLNIPKKLKQLSQNTHIEKEIPSDFVVISGGSDLWTQKDKPTQKLFALSNKKELVGIKIKDNRCFIKSATSIEEIKNSPLLKEIFPNIKTYFNKISSLPIRNVASIGGNIVNASPIGDLIIFFLVLNTKLTLTNYKMKREVLLKNFFKGYKDIDLKKGEIIEEISFEIPTKNIYINFEKVSKRGYLDIASVNSAINVEIENQIIKSVFISAGGVAPIPLLLTKTAKFLKGKEINNSILYEVKEIIESEICPIDDVRGSKNYKSLLLKQLIFAHLITLFPNNIKRDKI